MQDHSEQVLKFSLSESLKKCDGSKTASHSVAKATELNRSIAYVFSHVSN